MTSKQAAFNAASALESVGGPLLAEDEVGQPGLVLGEAVKFLKRVIRLFRHCNLHQAIRIAEFKIVHPQEV